MYKKQCINCSDNMFRYKKSEAERENWKFCSRSCQTSYKNKNIKKIAFISKDCQHCSSLIFGSPNNYKFINKRFCSRKCMMLNRNNTYSNEKRKEINNKISKSKIGKKLKKHSIESRLKKSQRFKGENSHFWKGGKTKINRIIRASTEYKIWRESVFQRDKHTCQFCNIRGGILNADHIKPFAYYPELRFDINNGRTLCEPCHKTTDTYMGRAKFAIV